MVQNLVSWKLPTISLTSQKATPVRPSGSRPTPKSSLTSSGSGKSGGGGGGNSGLKYARAAEKRARARENKLRAKTAKRYKEQAKTLGLQADALKKALDGGFKKALTQRLANIGIVFRQQDSALMEGYGERVGSLEDATQANEAARDDTAFAGLANRARERQSAVSNALLHGAGESDVLKTQMMSLRNWQANELETSWSYFDSLTSINSSLTDLTTDTKTARLNAESQYNKDQDQLWTDYFNRKSEAYTQLGNVQGQQAEFYSMANEMKSSGSSRSSQKKFSKASGKSFEKAADFSSKAWQNPGNSSRLLDWRGRDAFQGYANNSILSETGPSIPAPKKPEGATLRTWE